MTQCHGIEVDNAYLLCASRLASDSSDKNCPMSRARSKSACDLNLFLRKLVWYLTRRKDKNWPPQGAKSCGMLGVYTCTLAYLTTNSRQPKLDSKCKSLLVSRTLHSWNNYQHFLDTENLHLDIIFRRTKKRDFR